MERSVNYLNDFNELIHSHFNFTQAFQNVISMLGVEYAKMNNLPDSEFSDAYMSFRSRVESAIREFFGAEEPLSPSQFWRVDLVVRKLAAGGVVWVAQFFLGEGVQPQPRDPNTFSLDPAPFKEMIDIIMKKSTRVDYSNVYTDTQSINDYTKLKNFAKSIIESISVHGPTQAIVQRQFYTSVVTVIDSIGATSVKQEVHRETKQYSVEVKKGSGTVVLGSYVSSFDGIVSTSCCSDSQEVTMKVAVKVWKFATVRQLKEEFERLTA